MGAAHGVVRPDDETAEAVLARLARWAPSRADVVAVVLVGSFARDEQRADSDVDVVLVDAVDALLRDDSWLPTVGPGAREIRRRRWGVVVERRLQLASGLVVEVDVAPASWPSSPLDPGTAAVLRRGARPVYDPTGVVTTAITLAAAGPPPVRPACGVHRDRVSRSRPPA